MADDSRENEAKTPLVYQQPLKFLHKWIDDNLRVVRYSSYGLAVIGIVILARNVRLTAKFGQISEIPDHFIAKHVTLQGKVQHIDPTGVLMVDHSPLYRPKLLHSTTSASSWLPIQIASVDIHESGLEWLQNNVCGKHIWFQLLAVNSQQCAECRVSMKKGMFTKICVNKEIVRLGCGVLQPLPPGGCENEAIYDKLQRTLMTSQLRAEKRKLGLWKEPTYRERWTEWKEDRKINSWFGFVKKGVKYLSSVVRRE
ncbi:hypothetical protein CAPTEDRAFT_207678 [Capitella teleta]|uniref:TNase-like domain-containing protein n=1 Tax=Capitella teleta TaxID=283909 RepID=R7UTP3_CAPTE|nr:hypothetical protein CAPTEDRAFT_207678 [Capitella teleta]|eukprot:ELU09889.1 hypothetical protein CAPTEDRAFT_207678 [Capitella teleta]